MEKHVAEQFKKQMEGPDLVFITHENQSIIAAEIAAKQERCEHVVEKFEMQSPVKDHLDTVRIIRTVCKKCHKEWPVEEHRLEAEPEKAEGEVDEII